jgi:hypothetical protein
MAAKGSEKTYFKKGKSGNPKGRPTVPKEIRDIKKLSADELAEIVSTLFFATDAEIASLINDPDAPKLKKIVASILNKTAESGNATQLDQLLNRVIGKVQDKVTHTITRPSILVRQDGTEVLFTNRPVDEEE